MLLGRVTYEGFAAAWPERTDEAGFADKMNGMRKYVVSSTLSEPDWNNSVVLSGDLAEEAAKLKAEQAGDILVAGSGQLVQGLTERHLVDEYRLMVSRSVLGSGKRLFEGGGDPLTLELAEAKPVGGDGVITPHLPPGGGVTALGADRRRAGDHRLELAVGDVARQVLHPAVGRRDSSSGRLYGSARRMRAATVSGVSTSWRRRDRSRPG